MTKKTIYKILIYIKEVVFFLVFLINDQRLNIKKNKNKKRGKLLITILKFLLLYFLFLNINIIVLSVNFKIKFVNEYQF